MRNAPWEVESNKVADIGREVVGTVEEADIVRGHTDVDVDLSRTVSWGTGNGRGRGS